MVRKTVIAKTLQASIYENWLLSTYKSYFDQENNKPQMNALEYPGVPITLYDRILILLGVVVIFLVVAWMLVLIWT